VFSAVRGLPRPADETGRQNVVRPRPRIPRTAIISKDDEPHDLRQLLPGDSRNYIGPPGTVGEGKGRQKTAEDGRGRGTTQCRPSWSLALTCRASSGKDGTGRWDVVRPRPGPGRTDCPVANTLKRSPVAPSTGYRTLILILLYAIGRTSQTGEIQP